MKKISYIYIIENVINSKFYLGSTNNLAKRKWQHFKILKANKHHSIVLQRAYNKYGKESFKFKTICICSIDEQLEVEQAYLDNLRPEYNTSKSSTAPMLGRKHSEKTLKKFKNRKIISGKNHYLYGKTWTEERRDLILTARKKSGYKHSEETKKKMRETSLRIDKKESLDKCREKSMKKIIDSVGNTFPSLVECAKFWGISPATVCDILKGRHNKTKKGIIFKYAK